MRKVEMTAEEQKFAAVLYRNYLANGAILLPTITKTSKTNMSYRYQVKMAYVEGAKGIEIMNLTYWLASELGKNLTDDDEIKGSGCGFDRYHDAVYTIADVLGRKYGFEFSLTNMPKWARG